MSGGEDSGGASGSPRPKWSVVKEILGDALDLPVPDRGAFLDRACAGDAALRARVEQLLGASEGKEDTLNPDAGRIASALKEELASGSLDAVGKKIGRYKVERLIGRGGMGAVYEARDQTLNRQVALKIVGAAFAAEDVLRRFSHESRVLARLQHSGIAQVYESGIHNEPGFGTPTPYFAMELVEGATPITAYCRDAKLGTEQILALLSTVCDAVHHGHQRGVIHRDLKPGNILVGAHGAAKVIDFGVARVMDSDVAATARTREGQIVGTLNYMSPEQCRGDTERIDTRSDVYSLGVVLYECLTGRTPYLAATQAQHTPAGSNLMAMLRAIEQEAPTRLSRWDRSLRGDVETIVLKTLEKDPAQRYPSAAELGAELQRVLAQQPIAAHPPSPAYELSMFVRRNRTLVGAAGLVLVALVGGIIGTGVGLARAKQAQVNAEREAQRAKRIATFFTKTFRSADPSALPLDTPMRLPSDLYAAETVTNPDGQWGRAQQAGEQTTVKDVLRFAADHLGEEFKDDPVLESELRLAVGEILNQLNDSVFGVPQALEGLRGLEATLPDEDPRLIRARWLIGTGYMVNPTPVKSLPLFDGALRGSLKTYGPAHTFTFLIRRDRIYCLSLIENGNVESIKLQHQLIADVEAAKGVDSPAAWLERAALTKLLRDARRIPEAVENGRAAIAGLDRVAGKLNGPSIRARKDLYQAMGPNREYSEEAFAVLNEAVELSRKFYGTNHPTTADLRGYQTIETLRRHDLPRAEMLARESLDFSRRIFGPDSDSIGRVDAALARILIWQEKDAQEALDLCNHAIRISLDILKQPPGEDFLSYFYAVRAGALRLLGRSDEALVDLRTQIEARKGITFVSPWVEMMVYSELCANLLVKGDIEGARQALERAEAEAPRLRDPTFPTVLYVRDMRTRFDAAANASPAR